MTIQEIAGLVVEACKAVGIPSMIVGSLSSNYYGIPRSTKDADLVVFLAEGQLRQLAALLSPTLRLDSQPLIESVTATTKYVFDMADRPLVVELFALSDDPHDQERFRRRRTVTAYGHDVAIPTPEDVIVWKLRWYDRARRSRDWDDVKNVLAVQGNALDWAYIEGWCDRHGSRAHLDQLRAEVARFIE